jgi:small subunit ribosomal protein S16
LQAADAPITEREWETAVAVRIRMKKLGRKHRPYYRIVAIDGRQPRDGRIIEELGSYDPMIKNTDDRVKLRAARVKYWMSVGAQPSENVAVLLKKYLSKAEQQEAEAAAAPQAAPAGEAPPTA